MDVKIWTLDPMKLAYVEHVGPYTEVDQAWGKLCGWAGPNGIYNERTRFFGIYHDNPEEIPAAELRSEACITVDNESDNAGVVKFKDVPGGKFAVTTHLGPYTNLAESWMEFYMKWLPTSGMEHAESPCYEQYMNDPNSTKPEQLVTLLLMPLK
ncbi:AraC family transcriptional regulator [Maridesulfovibrio ferrireducens]|uniref:AraC family transcriptional regulator n=1 Tax=Maridesulfovibrio ferrireducens TaxID=246191 RepID=A0A1G9JVM5_9BACT|nr:GyrI-like domain-containing protein [Maridesulfovibrio ferrireducens]SDL41316.1 AraC family transcriptional regulator [Maridesulfovibrio ferrireducens]